MGRPDNDPLSINGHWTHLYPEPSAEAMAFMATGEEGELVDDPGKFDAVVVDPFRRRYPTRAYVHRVVDKDETLPKDQGFEESLDDKREKLFGDLQSKARNFAQSHNRLMFQLSKHASPGDKKNLSKLIRDVKIFKDANRYPGVAGIISMEIFHDDKAVSAFFVALGYQCSAIDQYNQLGDAQAEYNAMYKVWENLVALQ